MNNTLQEEINNIIIDETDQIRVLRSELKECLKKMIEFATDAHDSVHDKSVSLQIEMAKGFLDGAKYYNEELELSYERMQNRIAIARSEAR